ncbi:hypothetical protein [Mesobacterium pallidum]|uniref:hypothetical protein n=1 Tax=Mesobacterium pallidum TaxID=2872037 RepID=UPI001EE37413|nr:hypothetical protein [Mesobacterium pallidum]
MKPDFALSLSFDGISLLVREGAAWRAIDRVAIDSPDLTAALAGMRRKAEDTATSKLLSKLLIPEAQIRFMEIALPQAGDPAEIVRAALEGATPYPVNDLVWDWAIDGEVIRIAAVARETLDEAEDFARTNGFNPVSFAAAPGVGGMGTEVFFGPTRLGSTLLAPWQKVTRDGPAPVQARASETAEPEATPEGEPEASPDPLPVFIHDRGAPDPAEAEVPASDEAAAVIPAPEEPDEAAERDADAPGPLADHVQGPPEDQEPTPPPLAAHAPAFQAAKDPEPVFTHVRPEPQSPPPTAPGPDRPQVAARLTIPPAPAAGLAASSPAPDLPVGSFHSIRATRGEPAAAPSPRLDGASRGNISAPGIPIPGFRAAPEDALDEPLPPKPAPAIIRDRVNGTAQANDAAPAFDAPDAQDPNEERKAEVASNLGRILQRSRATRADSLPPGLAAAMTPPAAEAAPEESPAARMRKLMARRSGTATRDSDPEAAARREQMEAERERMTVFGARGNAKAQIGGKPRFLGLALTLVLLLFMAAVAALASTYGDRIVALFRAPDAPITVAQPAPEILPEAPDAGTPEVTGPQISLTEADPGVDTAPETPDVQALRQPAPQPSQAVTPEAAQARYAATGIWPAAPDAPMPPRISLQEQLQVAAIDPNLGLPRLPERPGAGTAPSADDSGILVQAPPPPGVIYDLDARGMIVPTPEGIVTPDRFLLVAGRPPLLPPTRGGLVDPDTGQVTLAALAQPEAFNPGISPRLRPEGLAPAPETAAPEAAPEPTAPEAAAEEDPLVTPEAPELSDTATPPDAIATEEQPAAQATVPFDGPTPPARPVGLGSLAPLGQPEAAAPEAPVEEPVATEDSAAALPVFDGPRPRPRPAEVETRATAAAPSAPEAALEAEVEAEVEAEPEPAATTILNATNQAVSASLVPSGRPANFSRQIARAERQAAREPAPQQVAQVAPRTVQQSAQTAASVSTQATVRNAINLNRLNLIGVYGKPSSRRALVRLPNGSYKKVQVGDRIDGGRIAAIGEAELQYTKNGRSITLSMPRG